MDLTVEVPSLWLMVFFSVRYSLLYDVMNRCSFRSSASASVNSSNPTTSSIAILHDSTSAAGHTTRIRPALPRLIASTHQARATIVLPQPGS